MQVNGTAQHSIASESLIETERLSGSEREAHEMAIAGTLGTMYIGWFYPWYLDRLVSNDSLQPGPTLYARCPRDSFDILRSIPPSFSRSYRL